MSLNLIGGFVKNRTVAKTLSIVLVFLFSSRVLSQEVNVDTPNLSFEENNFNGWKVYDGCYSHDQQNNEYYFHDWVENLNPTSATSHFEVVNGNSKSQDPVISCWDLPTNPDGITTARIGSTGAAESNPNPSTTRQVHPWATAEKLEYEFVVTENTTLLTYRFAAVLHCPDLVQNQQASHLGDQLPAFRISIVVEDTVTGVISKPTCGEVVVNGDSKSAIDLKLLPSNANRQCSGSKVTSNLNQFAYCPWTYGNMDLSKYLGKKVKITIINNDCLRVPDTNGEGHATSGSHRAYGYFWAQTRRCVLEVKNCGLDDAEITAPEGFDTYRWFTKGGSAIEPDPTNPRKAIVRANVIEDNVEYCCEMTNSSTECRPLTLSTKLHKVGVEMDFNSTDGCDGMVNFSCNAAPEGDEIIGYRWDFGDGTNPSYEQTPDAHYMAPGRYNVKLSITTKMGCTKDFTKAINVRFFPKLEISAFESICAGESLELSALNASDKSTYQWNTGETTKTIKLDSVVEPRDFEVTVIDEFQCEYVKDIHVDVKPVANFKIEGNDTICLKDTVRLTVIPDNLSKEAIFVWNTNDTTLNFKACPLYNPNNNTIYTVTATMPHGCPTTKHIPIHVNQLPIVTLSGTADVCKGDEAEMKAEASNGFGEITYVWDDLYNGDLRTERPDTTTTYTVHAVDEHKCSSLPQSHTVKVRQFPVLQLSGDTVICDGQTTKMTLTGASSSTIKWYDGTSGVNSIVRVPTQDTTYWAEGESNGCRSRAELSVRLLEKPSFYVSGDMGVCPGGKTVIKAQGADHYKWGNGQEGDSLIIEPTTSTKYILYGYSKDDCMTTDSFNITVHPTPLVYTKGDQQACLGSMVKVEAFDAYEGRTGFLWETGNVGSAIMVPVNNDVKIKVVAENEYGCKDSTYHEIALTTPPVLSYTGDTVVCKGASTTLQASGAYTYTWDDGQNESTGPSFTFTPNGNTRIRLTGSVVANCPSTITIMVGVNSLPTLTMTGDSIVCLGDEFSLYVSGADSYLWNTGDTTSSITYKLGSPIEYSVKGTDKNGCSSVVRKLVDVRPSPIVNIRKGNQNGCPELPDTINLFVEGAKIYQWSAIPANESVDKYGFSSQLKAAITEPTLFMVEGKDEYGCVGNAEINIELLKRQPLEFDVYPTFIETGSSNVRFSGIFPKESTWYWETDDNRKVVEGLNVSHNFDATAADSFVVTVKAVDRFGCEYKGSKAIYTWIDFWAPEGFTPNGDDMNDSFKFFGGEYMDEFSFIIYNRLGEIVYEGHNIRDEWDGTFNGEACPWGVYGWYCKYKSTYQGINREGDRKGFVSLIR